MLMFSRKSPGDLDIAYSDEDEAEIEAEAEVQTPPVEMKEEKEIAEESISGDILD